MINASSVHDPQALKGRPDDLQNMHATVSHPQGRNFHVEWKSFSFL